MPPENKSVLQTREMGPLNVRAQFLPKTVDKEKRTVELTWSVGSPVLRSSYYGDDWYEELSLDSKCVRMGRLESGRAPYLDCHRGYSLDSVLGVIEKASIVNGEGRATVRFSKRADVEAVFQDVCDGILPNVSVGYNVYEYEDASPPDSKIKTWRAIDWEPFEISQVPMGADDKASVRSRGADERHTVKFLSRADSASQKGETMTPEEKIIADAAAAAAAVRSQAAPVVPVVVATRSEADILAEERVRASEIRSAVKLAGLEAEFAERMVDNGVALDKARGDIFAELKKRSDKTPTITPAKIDVTRDAGDVLVRGCEEALLTRYDSKRFAPTEQGKLFRAHSLMDFAREFLQLSGVSTRGMGKMEIASLALQKRALHDTTDFPSLLANVANKTLRMAYDYAPKTYEPLTRYTEAPDFKQISRTQLGDAPQLVKVGEGGEITYGTIGDAKEVYTLATYARIIAITRQVIVNDDLDAFTRIPSQYGVSAAQLQSDLAWLQITGNPTMGDSNALFDSTNHGNYTSSGTVISVTSLGVGRSLMRKQTGLNGMKINLTPMFLVVPTALETIADQYVTAAFLANQPSNINPFAGRMKVISEPRLDAASATAWYMGADTNQIDILEMAFLQGQQGVYVETKIGFDVDGVEMKARLDCASKVIDWRGLYKNVGA